MLNAKTSTVTRNGFLQLRLIILLIDQIALYGCMKIDHTGILGNSATESHRDLLQNEISIIRWT